MPSLGVGVRAVSNTAPTATASNGDNSTPPPNIQLGTVFHNHNSSSLTITATPNETGSATLFIITNENSKPYHLHRHSPTSFQLGSNMGQWNEQSARIIWNNDVGNYWTVQ